MSNDDFKDLEELDEELAADSGEEESQEPMELPESKPRWTPSGPCFRAESADTEKCLQWMERWSQSPSSRLLRKILNCIISCL